MGIESCIPGPFPISPEKLLEYVRKFEPEATRITYSCGHVEISGGNMADPSCAMADAARTVKFVESPEKCSECIEEGK